MINCTPLSNALRETLKKLFIDYSTLGGMPEVVNTYIKSNLFTNVLNIQRELLEDYKGDIKKYAEGLDKTRIINVFNRIPLQLAEENKKFQISKLSREARYKDYWGCVEWLNEAGIINICYCLHTPDLPIKGNYEETKYKIYFKDTGFIIASLDDESQQDFRHNKNFNVYKGALYENIVGEALVKQGYDSFYYKRENSTLEENFFLRTTKSLVPVEVKSKDGRVKSLRTVIDSDKYPDIKKGIKLCDNNIGYDNNIYTFPYFCTFLLKDYLKQVEF